MFNGPAAQGEKFRPHKAHAGESSRGKIKVWFMNDEKLFEKVISDSWLGPKVSQSIIQAAVNEKINPFQISRMKQAQSH